jgi:hypothetical protein
VTPTSSVIAFEVKAAQRIGSADLRPLRKLRDALGPAFLAGVALHLGSHSYRADDRLHVAPVGQLWTTSAT